MRNVQNISKNLHANMLTMASLSHHLCFRAAEGRVPTRYDKIFQNNCPIFTLISMV